jgi:hypothetical protein
LYAHIFGVFLLNERESVLGILGSVLMAAGIVTLNGAKASRSRAAKSGTPAREGPPLPTHRYESVLHSSEPEPAVPAGVQMSAAAGRSLPAAKTGAGASSCATKADVAAFKAVP